MVELLVYIVFCVRKCGVDGLCKRLLGGIMMDIEEIIFMIIFLMYEFLVLIVNCMLGNLLVLFDKVVVYVEVKKFDLVNLMSVCLVLDMYLFMW